ncbi:MAG: Slp family lipoprotein [Gammaproteobacteria bacterium]|nr:Slp family lipoprotein [Gammaproteobacteria bacterium]
MISRLLFIIVISLLAGCASKPSFDTRQVDPSLTPQSVLAELELTRDKTALWGGTILDTRNLEDSTQIEILAYPLNSSYRPLLDSKPLGRFIIKHPGYLEPATYGPGRLLSVLGKVAGSQTGNVGESTYTYAVIHSQQLHLWSPESMKSRTSFHFGVGIRR